jgi:ABC-type transport system involved in cytochrome c biogenesis permease component
MNNIMKNVLLRIALAALYAICMPLAAGWLVLSFVPVLLVMLVYWLTTGEMEPEKFLPFCVLPLFFPFMLSEYLKENNIKF